MTRPGPAREAAAHESHLGLWEHCGASAFSHHFFYRAAKIYIKKIGLYSIHNFSAHSHSIFITAKYLYADGPFFIKYIKLLPALYGITYQAFTAYKFCVH